jgi:hypothetical protein
MENRTSAAKAGYGSVIYGTAEPVPFQDPVLTQTHSPGGGSKPLNTLHQMVHRFTGAIGWPALQLNAR